MFMALEGASSDGKSAPSGVTGWVSSAAVLAVSEHAVLFPCVHGLVVGHNMEEDLWASIGLVLETRRLKAKSPWLDITHAGVANGMKS